ncbi:MAG: hypothetical protein UT53_C0024G0005 [Candidatus Yanofskybacteria bacterium GW2011_GWD2_39_48]|uniref:Adenylate kinase n=1 Tax=Candidatus Yanofskybacteria bacterium GW2011_GWD2_39_48 TaxID=1619031 RepID=A0A0G0SCB4_9BACT|nr:MAG: hypothetical protein UT53_C0024G0005 [Candidatus Yanofskybacteria bacterium GW2011_GWD2_39_48]
MDNNDTNKNPYGLLPPKVPLIFADGTDVYNKLKEAYITHPIGYFILAPSGAGKTHFINKQTEQHWIDGDHLWLSAKAHPDSQWWLEPYNIIDEIDQRSDIITVEAKKLGFWIMGASNNWLKPDAIVLPNWKTHKKYIKYRETHNYDGGAKSDRLQQVLDHRKQISRWKKQGVPNFKSIEEATEYLSNIIK